MSDKSPTYGQLDQALRALGYELKEIPGSHRLYSHRRPEAMIALPIMPYDKAMQPIHILTVRSILAESGLLQRDEFASFVGHGGRVAS
jgi:predicted RNA binding protein YcfA (HicA-like mRNA interferase family)